MNNLELLLSQDKEATVQTLVENKCSLCPNDDKFPDCGDCIEVLGNWLLSDDEDDHYSCAEHDVRNLFGSDDSREKLEADVRNLFGVEPTCEVIMRWLDRQAAITERDMQAKINDVCAWSTELQVKINELTAERDKLSALELNQRVKANEWRDKYYEAKRRLDDIRETVRNATIENVTLD